MPNVRVRNPYWIFFSASLRGSQPILDFLACHCRLKCPEAHIVDLCSPFTCLCLSLEGISAQCLRTCAVWSSPPFFWGPKFRPNAGFRTERRIRHPRLAVPQQWKLHMLRSWIRLPIQQHLPGDKIRLEPSDGPLHSRQLHRSVLQRCQLSHFLRKPMTLGTTSPGDWDGDMPQLGYHRFYCLDSQQTAVDCTNTQGVILFSSEQFSIDNTTGTDNLTASATTVTIIGVTTAAATTPSSAITTTSTSSSSSSSPSPSPSPTSSPSATSSVQTVALTLVLP